MTEGKGIGGKAGLGMGLWPLMAGAVGMLGYALGKNREKTPEEMKSEIEKWEKQTRLAQTAMLDLSACLSEKCRTLAEAEEKERLSKLREEELTRLWTEAEEKRRIAEARVKTLEAQLTEANKPQEAAKPPTPPPAEAPPEK